MEREYGVTIDVKKSSTLSVPGTFNPLVIIKKLNFNHSIIESKDKETKSPDRSKNYSPIKKNNFINLNYNSTNNPNKTPNNPLAKQGQNYNSINTNKLINSNNTENNNLLKSLRTNKNKKEKTEMGKTVKEFNNFKRNSPVRNFASPQKYEKEKAEKAGDKGEFTSTDVSCVTKISEKIFEKVEKRTNNFSSNRRDRDSKIALRGKSGQSEKNEYTKEKEKLNNSVHLETISEKGKKKKKKKDREAYNTLNNNNNKDAGVILPKIINTTINNKDCNISSSKNEEDKNLNSKEALRKNYSQSIAQFRKTSESVFAQKRSEANNSANSNFGCLNNNYTNRYTSVMKIYRDKKLHLFDKNKFFYYVILPGNSSYLVRNCMQHRINWKECSSNVTTLFNFKWQQNNIGIDFASLSKMSTIKQIVNHFEFHSAISNKCNLLINMMKYCESRNIEVFKILPFTVLIQYDSPNFITQMDNFNQFYNNIKDHVLDQATADRLKKDPLYSLSSNKENKQKKYSTLFSVPGVGNEKLGGKSNVFIDPNLYDNKNYWVVKACDLNRGRCIKIADSLSQIQKLVKKFYEGIYKDFANDNEDIEYEPFKSKNNLSDEEKKKIMNKKYRSNFVIIQKYIEKPLLYRGRKFDMRIWVLITHKMKVYIFKEGHLKTSSVGFDINVKNSYVHITNYSIQKYNEQFSKFEYGNEVSFKDFQAFLDEAYPNEKYDIQRDFVKRMKEIIEISTKAVKQKINQNERTFSFEIFGYDFIMDSEFNIYLLEINTNPGLEESSPLIKVLVPRMLDDALRLTIDDICETKYSFSQYIEETNVINNLNTINVKDEISNSNYNSSNQNNNSNGFNTTNAINNNTTVLNGFKEKEEVTSNCDDKKQQIYVSPFPVENYSDSDNLWELVCDLNEKEKVEKIEKPEKEKRRKRSKAKNKEEK